jgi:methyl coenzyme M reductase beta subunit
MEQEISATNVFLANLINYNTGSFGPVTSKTGGNSALSPVVIGFSFFSSSFSEPALGSLALFPPVLEVIPMRAQKMMMRRS